MAKIELVRRPSLISPKHLLRYVFFTEMQVEQAARILNTLIANDGKMPDTDWERFVLSSRGLYVKVMRKLRDVGMVEKKMGNFSICQDFSHAVTKLAEYWTQIVESHSEGDKGIEF